MGPGASRTRPEGRVSGGHLQAAPGKTRMRLLPPDGIGPRHAAYSIFAFGVILLALHLGRGSLYPWDEALTAMRALHMYEDGISLTVRTFAGPDFNKPPLYYWLAAVCFHLFGPGLFALRLPGVLFAVGCLVCVYRLTGKATGSAWAACFALACLATNPHWLNIARLGKLESASSFSLVAALLWGCFGKGRHTPAGGVLTGLLLSIGAWVKHPFFGAVLPLFYCYWKYCDHAAKPLRSFLWSSATFLLAGTGWYVYGLLTWGESFRDFYFVYNVAERLIYGIEGHDEGFFYPIKTALLYSPAAMCAFAASLPAFVVARRRGNWSGVSAVGIGWLMLLLLCGVTGKRAIYNVAWYPLCAVCAGYGAAWAVRCVASRPAGALPAVVSRFLRDKRCRVAGAVLVCVYNLIFIGVAYRAIPDHSPVESGVYRAVKLQAGGHDVVMTNVDAPAVLFFELGRQADVRIRSDGVDAAFIDAAFSRAASGETVYLVMEESKTAPGMNEALVTAAARRSGIHMDIVADSGRYRAVRLAPAEHPALQGR
ncbi:MAG: glycosyltransferase family 39 protein [Desulfovibrio sp.]|nr:glycosyltransferase family 39 protein [Desulfovibrio sp.]